MLQPANAATDVALDAPLVMTFTEPISTSTFVYEVISDTLQLQMQNIRPTAIQSDWSLAWSNDNMVVTFNHSPLVAATTYTITISTAKDMEGLDLLGLPYAWSFTTEGGSQAIYLPLVIRNGQ
jgi:hypothetical protein